MHQRPVPSREPRLRLLAIAAALALGPVVALAQASGPTVIHGQASINAQGKHLTVTTVNGAGTRHSAINWQSFSVPQGGTARFVQPDAGSTSINKVLGSDPSRILGTLSSNGRLVLVNPSGITVGSGAVVDTAGFTASTLRMSDADALAGRMRFEGGPSAGALQVDGSILARGGDVVLLSGDATVGSGAVVRAPDGAVVLAAGRSVEITGRGLEGIRMEVVAPTDSAVNLGTLEGDAVGIFAGSLRHSGFINATGAELDGGKLRLIGNHGSQIDGVVRAGGVLVALATTMKDGKGKDGDKKEKEREKEEKEKEDKEKAEKEKADREKAEREKAEKEARDKADKDKADKEAKDKAGQGQGSSASENGGAGNGRGEELATAPPSAPVDMPSPPQSDTSPAPAPAPPAVAAPAEPAPANGQPSPADTIAMTPDGAAPSSPQSSATTLALKEVIAAVRAPLTETASFLAEPLPRSSTTATDVLDKRKADADADEALQCVP